jgi:predicted DNA-binding transcriptional regulator AlpA
MDNPTPDQFLTTEQAAQVYGLTARALVERRRRGDGPPFVRLSPTCVRYRLSDLERYAEERTFMSTTEAAASSDGR